ncbi:MAG: MBOAT family protein [Clostridia bacterium]|nr:MBOAT family protein [Clostridia bacterium]
MLFSSIPFLYYFLPAVLILYFIAPKKLKNSVLMLASLFFYSWGEPKYVFLMITSIILGYVWGLLIERFKGRKLSKLFMTLSCVCGLGFLAYYKYADFFIENFNAVTGLSVPLLRIALPIGISFFTFQILSYTIDVYRGDVPAQKNIVNFAAYVSMFPQLIAGPIVRYVDVARELEERTITAEKIYNGAVRFIVGLSKKVLIANLLGELCDIFRASNEKTVLFYWIYAIAFSLHIYFDFSGYSDMAIGLGKIFGFNFIENFNYPYISKSITEFWRRWHMSLGSWFRDYVYIPMGGNRVGKLRWFFNIFVVWMLTGFWHGAEWNFIIWGLMFAVILIAEKLFLFKLLKKTPAVINHVYVMLLVIISFVVFNANGLTGAASDIGGMFGFAGVPAVNSETLYYLRSYAVVLIFGVVGALPVVTIGAKRLREFKAVRIIEPVVFAGLLLLVTAFLVDGSFNPFLYFRF